MKQQTAVQICISEIDKRLEGYLKIPTENEVTKLLQYELKRSLLECKWILEQVLPIEKQQIIEAYKAKASKNPIIQEMFDNQAITYYNETYNTTT